jgi:hypothetical protein
MTSTAAPGRNRDRLPAISNTPIPPTRTTQPIPSRMGPTASEPLLSRKESRGFSVHPPGLPTLTASGVDQPLGWASRLPGSVVGRVCQATAKDRMSSAMPITTDATSS